MRPHPKTGTMQYYLEGELQKKFIEKYPKHTNLQLMTWFGISLNTLQRFKRVYGLTKDLKAVRKIQARNVKKTCEKNGYYDSLRGKPLSEACREGARKKRTEGFHPLLQLKKDNPRRYKMLMKKRSEARKKLIQKERRRQELVLTRHTKLYMPVKPLSHTARAHKYAMIKKRNYFAVQGDPQSVYWDSQTKRSARREATAIRHGLRVVQGDEQENNLNNETT